MIDHKTITLAKNKFDLYTQGLLRGIEVDEVFGIEEGPKVGDEIKVSEATFNGQTYIYDQNDQKTIVGKVSEHKTVLHLARCNEGYHLFFATYDETVDLFGEYIFLGLISGTKPETPIESSELYYHGLLMKLVAQVSSIKNYLTK